MSALVRLLLRHYPREGWLVWLLGLTTLLLLPIAADAIGWTDWVGLVLAAAVVSGYVLASWLSRRVRGRYTAALAWLFLTALGMAVAALPAGWPEIAPLAAASLPVRVFAHAALAVGESARQLAAWGSALVNGTPAAAGALVVRFLVALLGWAVAAWAGWQLARGRSIAALLPAGLVLTLDAYLTWEGRVWLPLFLALFTAVAVLNERRQLEGRWQALGMDFSPHLQLELAVTAGALALTVAAATALMPSIRVEPIARWFDRMVEPVTSRIENRLHVLFPDLPQPDGGLRAAGGAGAMPRSHLLTDGPELSAAVVMRVQTSAAQDQRRRGLTYNLYSGRGWRNSPLAGQEVAAGEPWTSAPPAGQGVRQTVELVAGGDQPVYAAGEPLAVSRPARVLLRSPQDVAGLVVAARRYEVLSAQPLLDPAALRASGSIYPAEISEQYLALPDVLPPRVRALAVQLTREAVTPYDKALALEAALRGLRYSLDVEPPPAGRDAVDYFLFDSQAGYCDYFASAMVVLARSAGIPARLAVGYAAGRYDATGDQWLVRGADAHSWPELYFPAVGWVGFEPTPVQPASTTETVAAGPPLFAPALAASLQTELAEMAAAAQSRRQETLRGIGLAVAAMAAAAAALLGLRRRRHFSGDLALLYQWVVRRGERLGQPAVAGDSAAGYGRKLAGWLRREHAETAADAAERFVMYFEAARYSAESETAEQTARALWPRLRRLLRATRRGWRAVGLFDRYRAN